jgi:arylsulfatase A-like enzyme
MNLRVREVAALMLVVLLGPIMVHAQTLKPSYLSEMPAPARILAEIKGKDAEDTGERQMGAFMALIKMMDDMAWGLEHRNVNMADTRKSTPDEMRIRLGYQTAYADLWHKVTNKEGHVYDHDRDLLNEMLQKFFSESFRAKYFQAT